MPFISLPDDIILQVCKYLSSTDILSLRQASKYCEQISRERSIWFDLLTRCFVNERRPIAGLEDRPVSSLSAADIEHLVFHNSRYRRNWTSPRPIPTRSVKILPEPSARCARARNLALHFLPGRGNRWLLSVTLYDQASTPRTFVLQCWDIQNDFNCVATFHCFDLVSVIVNSDPNHPAMVSLSRRAGPHSQDNGPIVTTMLSIDFAAKCKETAFTALLDFPSLRNSMVLQGSTFISTDSGNSVRIYDANTGRLLHILRTPMLHEDPTLHFEEFRCLSVVLLDDFVLTFCRQWIHLYATPQPGSAGPISSSLEASESFPIAKFRWQWRIDSLVVSAQPRAARFSTVQSSQPCPISILIRFDTWFPWPVNILHHFILPPNSSFRESSVAHPSELPYLSSDSPSHRPFLVDSLSSPVRIFTPFDMVLGRYGTALWIDAHSDVNSPPQAGDHGQRIAGKILKTVCMEETDRVATASGSPVTVGDDHVSPGYAVLPVNAEGDSVDGTENELEESEVMIFHVREHDDGWNRVALDEEEGRIAVGSTDGKILLFEYAPQRTVPLRREIRVD